jgi:hypothetical protein
MPVTEKVTMREAASILGVSPVKLWQLVKEGTIPVHANPLDRRQKLVNVADLEKLKAGRRVQVRPQTAGLYDGPVTVHSDELEEYMEAHWRPS